MDTDHTAINPRTDQHPLLILKLPGNLTGDLWHFAAAIALYGGVQIPAIEAMPLAAVSVIEYTWLVDEDKRKAAIALKDKEEQKKALSESGQYVVSHYLKRGIVSFDYLRSIGAPTLLVRLAQLTATNNPDEETYKKVSGDYALHLLDVLSRTQHAAWLDVYSETKPSPFNFVPKVMPKYPDADVGVKSVWANYDKKDIPGTIGLDNIVLKSKGKPPLIWDNASKGQDGPFVATAITMMYLADPRTRAERIRILQRQLAGDPQGGWWEQAKALKQKLLEIYIQGSKKKILLFNYRLGDVNRQHDANLFLFQQVSKLASDHNMLCVPIFVSASDAEANAVKKLCGNAWIGLYIKDVHYDKRYTAAFWTLVANEMANEVFGLIGGRSGSMDIASFMGVNCCEWDEPLCDPELSAIYEDQNYVIQNIDQCLRLFNQIYNMSIIYLDPGSMITFAQGHGEYEKMMEINKNTNCYTSIFKGEFVKWLNRPFTIATPTIYPSFPKALNFDGRMLVDITKYKNPKSFRNMVTGTFVKLENANAKISAVALREMGFDQVLLLPDEKPGYKAPEKKGKPDPAELKLLQEAKERAKIAKAQAKKEAEELALKAAKEKAANEDPPPTSTQPQANATLTPQEALVTQMGTDGGEDAGDVSNVNPFLSKDNK